MKGKEPYSDELVNYAGVEWHSARWRWGGGHAAPGAWRWGRRRWPRLAFAVLTAAAGRPDYVCGYVRRTNHQLTRFTQGNDLVDNHQGLGWPLTVRRNASFSLRFHEKRDAQIRAEWTDLSNHFRHPVNFKSCVFDLFHFSAPTPKRDTRHVTYVVECYESSSM